MRWSLLVPICLLLGAPAAGADTLLTPPVDAVIARDFDGPDVEWGPGHRGIDYSVPYGSQVRAAGQGWVSFAGRVAGHLAVTIDHGDGIETTYTQLSALSVRAGETVMEGSWIGRSGYPHAGAEAGLHFGVKLDELYVDPMLYLGVLDTSAAIALAPLDEDVHGHARSCNPSANIPDDVPAPNDNLVVVVGGITSSTGSPPELFEAPARLGYDEDEIYRFSYRGPNGPDLHQPYFKEDTYRDLRIGAVELENLLRRIAEEHPGRDVDIVAHSQGGLIARAYLTEQAATWEPARPRVQHLVTFATPHQGVHAAAEVDQLKEGPLGSRLFAESLDRLSGAGLPIPPPDSTAVRQMRPGSELVSALAEQDVAFGTRVLALAVPNDLLVPADRAALPGKPARVVPSDGLFGHGAIQRSPRALQMARAFLAGAGPACPPDLGFFDSHVDEVIDGGQRVAAEIAGAVFRSALPF